MLLQSCLGLRLDAASSQLVFRRPILPVWLREVCLTGIRLPKGSVDLVIQRYDRDVSINVTRREGGVEVVAYK